MPIVTLRTDLTTLPYSLDRPGGDYSGQPYIKTPVPDITPPSTDPSAALFEAFQKANRSTLDFPIRGGSLTYNGPGGLASTPAGEIDRMRIKAFLEDKVRGETFLLKQKGLQLSNPNVPRRGINIDNGVIPATRVYDDTGNSLLAQVTVQGTGRRTQRFGSAPVYITSEGDTYESYTRSNDTILDNRLLLLYQTKIGLDNPLSPYFINDFYNVLRAGVSLVSGRVAEKYGISANFGEIYNYEGGPGSTYGVGTTTIKRVDDTTQAANKAALLNNAFTFTYQQLINQNTSTGTIFNPIPRQRIGAKIQDFRSQLNTATGLPANYLTADYNDTKKWYNPAIKGDPGALETRRRVSYTDVNDAKVDKVNNTGLYYYDPTQENPFDYENSKDIIKFGFECISNDSSNRAVALFFRAFLTSFTDNHQAEYNSFKYLGRGETFRTYQGFDRSISFGFKIAAQTREEMLSLYTKLNHLISQVYPDYSPTSKFMRAPVVQLTIGDYMYRMPGFIENVNLTLLNEAAWEIALDPNSKDDDINQVPQMVEVQCNFKPIHDFLPKREPIPLNLLYVNDSSIVPPFIGVRSKEDSWVGGTFQGSALRRLKISETYPESTISNQEYYQNRYGSPSATANQSTTTQTNQQASSAATTATQQPAAKPTVTVTKNWGGKTYFPLYSTYCGNSKEVKDARLSIGTVLEVLQIVSNGCSDNKAAWYEVQVKGDPTKKGWAYSRNVTAPQ